MEKYDVLVQGMVSTDVIFASIPKMPQPGEEVYCGDFEFTGGAAYITAVALSRLGMKVAVLAPIGNDLLSNFILQSLEAEGVATHLMKKLEQPLRTLSVAINYGGDRAFLSYQDEAKGFDMETYTNDILENVEADILHMSAVPNSLSTIKLAKQKQIQVALDMGWDEDWLKDQKLIELIQSSDYFTPNLKEALYITEEDSALSALQKFKEQCPETQTIIKLGEEGALIHTEGEDLIVPGLKRDAIDSTGAGDVFSAGMLTGILKGFTMEKAIQLGNYCGACSVEGLGGATTSPYWSQVEKEFLHTN